MVRPSPRIASVEVTAYTIPTDAPESDGTIAWSETTLVLVEIEAGGKRGIGYSYAPPAAAAVARDTLAARVDGMPAFDVVSAWGAMRGSVRNMGSRGIAACAIAAVDTALWDLKARLLDVPLVDLFGAAQHSVPVYGSGGFTSYDEARLRDQLSGWADAGIGAVKMKVGRDPSHDIDRVRVARDAVGDDVVLMVDANGAYHRKQALHFAERFADLDVRWFEEPVTSDDVDGLRLLRDRAPASMDIAAGEYGYADDHFRTLLAAGAVDVLQADATRCCGYTGFLRAAALCGAYHLPLSAHTAPALHLPVACAAAAVRHIEYFHDHVRIESLLFDGVIEPRAGQLSPARDRPGNGLAFRRADAVPYRAA